MSQVEASYEEMKQKVIDEIEKHRKIYLATSVGDHVTVRRVGVISDGLKMWFVTDHESRKYKQIEINPNVAVALGDNLQIEGIATLKGHPMDVENSDYIQAFKLQFSEMYERVSRPGRNLQRKGSRVIEVYPTRVSLGVAKLEWDLEPDFKPYTLILNTAREKAFKIYGTKENLTDSYKTSAYNE